MKTMLPLLAAAPLAAMAAPAPALAQTAAQTPANAQRFIAIVVGQGSVSINATIEFEREMKEGWNCGGGKSVCYSRINRTTKVSGVSASPNNCATTLTATFGSFKQQYATAYPVRATHNFTIDWSRVAAVSTDYSRISLPGTNYTLYFATSEVATRVAAAFEVLRKSCDPTGGTGF